MARLNLIISDYDTKYVQGLSSFLGNTYKDKFNIISYTNAEILIEELKKQKKKDILLINKDMFVDKMASLGIKTIILLGEGQISNGNSPYTIINKYQSGTAIYNEVIKAFAEQDSSNIEKITRKYDNTKILSVYSPIGGSGKTTYAVALSLALSGKGESVLYVNFEDVQSTEVYFKGDKSGNFSDLMYYVKERADNFGAKVLDLVNKDEETGVSFFNSTENALDIEDMDKEDIKWFIESLIGLNMFSYIVFDTSSKLNSIYQMILGSSDNIICPITKEKTAIEKLKLFVDSVGDIKNYLFFYNKGRADVNIPNPQNLEDNNKSIMFNVPVDFNMYLNEGKDLLNSPLIAGGVATIINTLTL